MKKTGRDFCGLIGCLFYSANSVFKSCIPNKSGLYRVRSSSYEGLVYVGQTGRDLKERTIIFLRNHSLPEINNPPWDESHTQQLQYLWAYRIDNQFDYKVAVAETENFQ